MCYVEDVPNNLCRHMINKFNNSQYVFGHIACGHHSTWAMSRHYWPCEVRELVWKHRVVRVALWMEVTY